jgi:hypothetical protein
MGVIIMESWATSGARNRTAGEEYAYPACGDRVAHIVTFFIDERLGLCVDID